MRHALLVSLLTIAFAIVAEDGSVALDAIPSRKLADGIFLQAGDVAIRAAQVDRVEAIFITQRREQDKRFMLLPDDRRLLRRRMAAQLLENALLEKHAAEQGLALKPEELDRRVTETKEKLRRAGRSFEQYLADSAQTEEEFRRFWGAKWALEEKLGAGITAADLDTFFNERKDDDLPLRRASHILIAARVTAAQAGEAERRRQEDLAKARARAEGVLAQLRTGASFPELARAESTCPSAAQGGDLGFIPRQGYSDAMPGYADVARTLYSLKNVGDFGPILESAAGFHIVRLTGVRSREEMDGELRQRYIASRMRKLLDQLVLTALKQAAIDD